MDADSEAEEILRLAGSAPVDASSELGASIEARGDGPRFLKPGQAGETVSMVSYPRSGNSMLRDLLERLTGVVTGSDSRPDRAMALDLKLYRLVGEGSVGAHNGGGNVWVVKTHFPEKYGWKPFASQRAILLVRNPFNAIRSYFNMLLTGTHTHSIADSEFTRFADVWDRHVREEIGWWCEFHRYWLRQPIPLLVVRYEDLVESRPAAREASLRRIADFLYGPMHTRKRGYGSDDAADIEGAVENERTEVIEGRIQAVLADSSAGRVYKPRAAAVSTDLAHYTAAQQEFIVATATPMLLDLGYSDLLKEIGVIVAAETDGTATPELTPAAESGSAVAAGGSAADGDDGGGTKRKLGAAEDAPLVWCNKGKPMRPITKEDPAARGFMWKWALRKIVKVVQRGSGGTETVVGGATTSSTEDAEGEDYRVVSQDAIRQYEDLVVGVAKSGDAGDNSVKT
eukprot:COSAG03_NODE_12_length_22635_cov_7.308307_14_plen_456_part_00